VGAGCRVEREGGGGNRCFYTRMEGGITVVLGNGNVTYYHATNYYGDTVSDQSQLIAVAKCRC